jgi:hypothetical protein
VPHFHKDVGNWVTSLNVDNLVVKKSVKTLLIFDNVFADIFTTNVLFPNVRFAFQNSLPVKLLNSQYGPCVASGLRRQEPFNPPNKVS